MPTPDPRPAGETAEQRARTAVEDCLDYPPVQIDAALDAYRDAVAAEARAALLAGAPVVWVARDSGATTRLFSMQPQWDDDARDWFAPDFDPLQDLVDNWLADALGLTPGTCVRYRLVPGPEESP